MDRSQLTEEDYLRLHGLKELSEAGSKVHPHSALALSKPSDCPNCMRLLRAREGAAAQLSSLTRSLELSEEENSLLKEKLKDAQRLAVQVYWSALAGGIELDAIDLGIFDWVNESNAEINRDPCENTTNTVKKTSEQEGGKAGSNHSGSVVRCDAILNSEIPEDLSCESDGIFPTSLIDSLQPHRTSNVLSCAVLKEFSDGELIFASGAADGSLSISSFSSSSKNVLSTCSLPAPVLSICSRPSTAFQVRDGMNYYQLAACCMDGSAHLLQWEMMEGCTSSSIQNPSPPTVVHSHKHHDKFATRVAWCEDGSILAIASADGSLALYHVPLDAQLRCEKIQQVYFNAGAVEAMVWVCEQVGCEGMHSSSDSKWKTDQSNCSSQPPSNWQVDTLIVSARGSPYLFYIRVLRSSRVSMGGLDSASLARFHTATGMPLFTKLPPQVVSANTTTTAAPPTPTILIFRAPLSEDCAPGDVSWRVLLRLLLLATTDAKETETGGQVGTMGGVGDDSWSYAHPQSPAAPRQTTSLPSPPSSSLVILDLAVATVNRRCPERKTPFVAAASEGGVVYVFRLGKYGRRGSNAHELGDRVGNSGSYIHRRLQGRLVGSGAAAANVRMAWQQPLGGEGDPLHLAVSSEDGGGVDIVSVGSGKQVARLALPQGGTVKDLAWAPSSRARLLTCGFDKRVTLWGSHSTPK